MATIKISPSALRAYQSCGERYRLQYIQKAPPPVGPSPALVRGLALHKGAEMALRTVVEQKREGRPREDLPVEAVAQAAVEEFEQIEQGVRVYERDDGTVVRDEGPPPAWDLFGEKSGANKDMVAKGLAPAWCEKICPRVDPEGVETWGHVPFEQEDGTSVLLRLRFDVLPADGVLTDLKTTKRAFGKIRYATADDAEDDPQLTAQDIAYRHLTGKVPEAVGFDTLAVERHGVDAHYPRVAPRSDAQIGDYLQRADRLVNGIKKGVFIPARRGEDWWCSAKWCPYFRVCAFGEK